MSELSRHPPSDACLSDLALDRWVAGDRGADPGDHLTSCERCRARVAAFEEARELAAPMVGRALARAQERAAMRRPGWQRWLLGAGVAVAASAAVLLMTVSTTEPNGVRAKGSSMRFVVQRQGRVFAGTSGELFRAGDALRFLVSSGGRAQFFLVGIEESGRVSAYHPYDGEVSIELGPGADTPLPGSLVLDNSRGTEYFLGIFAEEPVTLEAIETAVAEARAGGSSLSALRQLPLPGSHHWVVIRKE